MEMRTIGSLEVSLVGLGCNNFGGRLDAERTASVVHAALDAGITFFDTADVYGGTRSEELLGRALGARRDEVVIATKFGNQVGDDPAQKGASARWIREAVEASLRRLGTDRIDLYQQHVPDDSVPIEETQEALDRLVRDGKVREIGSSNFDGAQIDAAAALAAERGWAPFVSIQNQLNLVQRGALEEAVPAAERHGLKVLPYFPLASGMLTGKYRRGEPPPEGTRLAGMPAERVERAMSDRVFDRVERLTAFAEARDHTILELAFAWLVALPSMGSVIAGATSPEQVRANVAAVEWKLAPEEMRELDEVLASA
jgi:aryl-alcohol dehydrogenase-like predicted oxidoreductase